MKDRKLIRKERRLRLIANALGTRLNTVCDSNDELQKALDDRSREVYELQKEDEQRESTLRDYKQEILRLKAAIGTYKLKTERFRRHREMLLDVMCHGEECNKGPLEVPTLLPLQTEGEPFEAV